MANTAYKDVDAYIAAQPKAVQRVLERVRTVIRKAVPQAQELISYQIPAYKVDGAMAIYFAGWKQHYSIYPASEALVAAFGDELADYELSKGTIRFPLSESVPVHLIQRIAKFRAHEAIERAKARSAVKAKAKTKVNVKAKTKAMRKVKVTTSTQRP